MADKKTFYDILQIGRDATQVQIKAAFRRLALYYHPDKVKHLGEAAQKRANETMKEITEAFSVLRDPEKRRFYDHCLDNKLDFTIEYSRVQSETKEERQERRQKKETFDYMLQAAARVVLENVKLLCDDAGWKVNDSDDYYDYVLKGLSDGNRMTVHIRVAQEFNLQEIQSIMESARKLEPETKSLLIRDHFSFLLVAARFKDGVEMREQVKKFNFENVARVGRGAPRRGLALVRLKSPKPFVPHGAMLAPRLSELDMKLV